MIIKVQRRKTISQSPNGIIISNVQVRRLETNASGIHVLDNLLVVREKEFLKC